MKEKTTSETALCIMIGDNPEAREGLAWTQEMGLELSVHETLEDSSTLKIAEASKLHDLRLIVIDLDLATTQKADDIEIIHNISANAGYADIIVSSDEPELVKRLNEIEGIQACSVSKMIEEVSSVPRITERFPALAAAI